MSHATIRLAGGTTLTIGPPMLEQDRATVLGLRNTWRSGRQGECVLYRLDRDEEVRFDSADIEEIEITE